MRDVRHIRREVAACDDLGAMDHAVIRCRPRAWLSHAKSVCERIRDICQHLQSLDCTTIWDVDDLLRIKLGTHIAPLPLGNAATFRSSLVGANALSPMRVWLYTRGAQYVRMVREVTSTGVVYLTLCGPDGATWMYVGTSLACEKYQAGLQDSLVAEGFHVSAITDRRQRDRVTFWPGHDPRRPDDSKFH